MVLSEYLLERAAETEPPQEVSSLQDLAAADTLWLDLEIDPQSKRLVEGALLAEQTVWRFDEAALRQHAVAAADCLNRARRLGGHNIMEFDLSELHRLLDGAAGGAGTLADWQTKCIDTLYLGTLAVPHQPRYALAKLYRLQDGHNNPVQDCLESRNIWNVCKGVWRRLPETLVVLFARLLPLEHLFPTASDKTPDWRELENLLPEGNRDALLTLLREAAAAAPSWANFGLAVAVHWLRHFNRPQARRPVWVGKHPQHGETFRRAEEAFLRWGDWDDEALNRECAALFPGLQNFGGLREGQLSIVRAIVQERDIPLGILPTGGGKSLSFQLPALLFSKYRRGLTVVVSPLKALIADQVFNLRQQTGLYAERVACLLSGQTEAEQKDILEGVWQGRIDILYVSPERLRTRSMRTLLKGRPPALWVLDEAHTLSQWGTDFRPDFLRIAEHIAACYDVPLSGSLQTQDLFAETQPANPHAVPAIGLVTATASARVKDDLQREFTDKLSLLTGGRPLKQYGTPVEKLQIRRPEIKFVFKKVPPAQRDAAILQLLQRRHLLYKIENPTHSKTGVSLVYIRNRKHCDAFAGQCRDRGFAAAAYHAGLPESERENIITLFKDNVFDVIVCTNAFGMGIDKEGIHTVIHNGPPANLESYVQESGRAARKKGEHARAYLFWSEADVEYLFRQERDNRIPNNKTLHDCWKIIRPVLKRPADDQWFADTDLAGVLHHENTMLHTQIRVALLALERHGLLVEKELQPACVGLKLLPVEAAAAPLPPHTDAVFQSLRRLLAQEMRPEREFVRFHLPELALDLGLSVKKLLSALHALVQAGRMQWRAVFGVRLRDKTVRAEQKMARLLKLAAVLREVWENGAVESGDDADVLLNVPVLDYALENRKPKFSTRQDVLPLLSAVGAVQYRSLSAAEVSLLSTEAAAACGEKWQGWLALAEARLPELSALLAYLCTCFGENGAADKTLSLIDLNETAEALGWLPETVLERLESLKKLGLIDLNRMGDSEGGLFFIGAAHGGRPRNYHEKAYAYLKGHYRERCQRLHLLYRWLRYGDEHDEANQALDAAERTARQNALLEDYFKKPLAEVVHAHCTDPEAAKLPYLKNYDKEILPDRFSEVQKSIVCEAGRAALVLAGPGAGKTAIVVHRVAYLLMKQDILPEKILILAYNRLAVAELRQRLYKLIGNHACGVTVSTFHGLARQITGMDENDAPANEVDDIKKQLKQDYPDTKDDDYSARCEWLLRQAAAQLRHRDDKLFYQYIMVDEFQDIDSTQYDLIAQLANLQPQDDAGSGSLWEQQGYLMAVGDDDQNLYAFRGASVEYIRQFAEHYHIDEQKQYFLTVNYRSCANIVDLANAYIQAALPDHERLKDETHAIRSHRSETFAPVRYGVFRQVRGIDAAAWLAEDIAKMQAQFPQQTVAVLARRWDELDAVQHYLEQQGIRSRRGNQSEMQHPLHSMVGQALLAHLYACADQVIEGKAIDYLEQWRTSGQNGSLPFNCLDMAWPALRHSVDGLENATGQMLIDALEGAVYEAGLPVSLLTFHSAKGTEFGFVYVLDEKRESDEVRPLYVALTRAKNRLTVLQQRDRCDAVLFRLLRENEAAEMFDVGAVLPPPQLCYHRFLSLSEIRLTPKSLVTEEGRKIVPVICAEGKWCEKPASFGEMVYRTEEGFSSRKRNMLVYFSNGFRGEMAKKSYDLKMTGFTTLYFRQTDFAYYRRYGYYGKETGHFLLLPYVRVCVDL